MLTVDSRLKSAERGEKQAMFERYDYPFLLAAFSSFLVSVALWFVVNHDYGIFVGLWVPSILALWVGVKLSLRKEQ